MKNRIALFVLSQFILSCSAHSQKIKRKDLVGKWVAIFFKDSVEFDFLDTTVTVKRISYSQRTDQNARTEAATTVNYYVVQFNNATLLVFDVLPYGFLNSTYLLKMLNVNKFEIQPIQNSDLSNYSVKWAQKDKSITLLVKRL